MEYSNELSVAFGVLKTKTTGGIYRLDEEQYLVFTDIELPEYFRADFGLSEKGDTISMVGTENRVLIPDELLVNAGKLHCWVWLDTGEYGGKTEYHVIVPIRQRGNVTDIQPTSAEQSTIDSLIDALNDGVERAEEAAEFLENVSAEAETVEPGSPATAHYENGVFSFGIPKGPKGDPGEAVQSDWNQSDSTQSDYIKNKPANLVQDASYVHTDNNYTTEEKTKLSGIEAQANKTVIDDTLTNTGEAADAKAVGDEISNVKAMIEPSAETSATSAHAYAAGDHFIYNGTLYRATAAIAIGDTITPESNCVATTVMTEVEAGGGTSDYTQLSNKPQINGNTLTGNKTGPDLGLVNAVTGKQLSTEDYTTAEKTKLSGIEAQANKTVIDSTLTQTGQAADAKAAGDAVSELRNTFDNNVGDVTVAYLSSSSKLYPFEIAPNTPITVEEAKGNTLPTGTIYFYDASKTLITYAAIAPTYGKTRTFTLSSQETVKYIGLSIDYSDGIRIFIRDQGSLLTRVSSIEEANVYGIKQSVMDVADRSNFTRLYSNQFEQGGIANSTGIEYDETHYVRSQYIPVIPGRLLAVKNETISSFWYSIHQYKADKTWDGALTLVDVGADKTFTLNSTCYYIRVVVLKNGFGALTPSDVDNAIIQFEWAKKTATLYREPFAYIGSGGKFSFYEYPVFNASTGKCAWRLTTDLCIKLPNVTAVKSFDTAQIIAALTNDDLYTDAGGTTWVCMRAGYALVYNDTTGTLQSVAVNGSTPIADNSYPILIFWSLQAAGGLLFDRFLNDSQALDIEMHHHTDLTKAIDNARHVKSAGTTPLTLLHFSDLHSDTAALSRIVSDASRYSSKIDEKICTGDMVANTYQTAEQFEAWWDESVLTCIGNHDSASYDSSTGYDWTALDMAGRSESYIEPFESNWNIIHTAGTSYYYKDYSTQKVRLIVMDAMLYTDNGAEATAQTSWLEGLLGDTLDSEDSAYGYHVLIAIHAPHGGAVSKACSFGWPEARTMPTYTDCNTPQAVVDVVASAITNGLKFIGYLVGHTHQDNIWDAESDGKQLMYCVTCSAVSQSAQWINSDQHRSVTEDAYNIVTIDTTNTLVKIIRGGGANMDNTMRPRKMICLNYTTGIIVGQDT